MWNNTTSDLMNPNTDPNYSFAFAHLFNFGRRKTEMHTPTKKYWAIMHTFSSDSTTSMIGLGGRGPAQQEST